MKILLVSGSPRKQSNSRQIIEFASEYLTSQGIAVEQFDVAIDRVPLMGGEGDSYTNSQVIRLQQLAQEADGFFFCTPEYHNGMSGVLKNALDFLNQAHFQSKPAAIAATCGGGKGGINALVNLRTVLRGVSALVTANQLAIDPDHLQASGIDEGVSQRLQALLDELVTLTTKLRRD